MERQPALARAALMRDLLGRCLAELRKLEETSGLETNEVNSISAAAGLVERAEDWLSFVGVPTS
jgi:hypothetical protein